MFTVAFMTKNGEKLHRESKIDDSMEFEDFLQRL